MNSGTIRASNRSAIFEAIRHYAPISRKVLAANSGLNPRPLPISWMTCLPRTWWWSRP